MADDPWAAFNPQGQGAAPAAPADDAWAAFSPQGQGAGQMSWSDVASEGGKGLVRGAEGFAGDLGEAVMGPFGPSHHFANLMSDFGLGDRPAPDPSYGQQLATATGMTANPQTTPGKYAGSIGEAVGNPASYFGPGGWLSKMFMAGASGAGGEAAAEAAPEGWEGPARLAGSLAAGPLAARAVKPQLGAAQQTLANSGVSMTPGQLGGGLFKSVEDAATSLPILGDFIKSGRMRSIEGFNKAVANQALEPIGESLDPATPAGHQAVGEVRDKLSNGYDQIVPYLKMTPDQQWFSDLQNIYDRNVQMLPQQHQDQFQRIIDSEFGRPTPITGQKAKVIEGNLNRLAGKFGGSPDANQQLLGEALGSTVAAMRSNMERTNPIFAQELSSLNQGYAMYARQRDAASRRVTSEGVFMPSDLLAAVKRGDRSVGKGSFARGEALMQAFGEAGQRVLPSKIPDSGTPGRAMVNGLLGGLGAPIALAHPIAASAIGAATLPFTRAGQYLANRYTAPTTGLRAGYANAGRGIGTLRPFMTMQNPYTNDGGQ